MIRDFSVKIALISYWSDFSLIPLGNVLLTGQLQKYAKIQILKILRTPSIQHQWVCPNFRVICEKNGPIFQEKSLTMIPFLPKWPLKMGRGFEARVVRPVGSGAGWRRSLHQKSEARERKEKEKREKKKKGEESERERCMVSVKHTLLRLAQLSWIFLQICCTK